MVLSEPDLLISRTDLSLVATVEGGHDWDHHRGGMSGKCAAGVWMVGTTGFGVPLRDADPWALGVLLLVLIFLNILPSDVLRAIC